MKNLITYENVTVEFEGNLVIQNFSLEIQAGDKIVIQGASGIGKSTLMKLLLGVVAPHSGNIYYRNELLTKDHIWKIRKQIAYAPQNYDISDGKVQAIIDEIFSYKSNKTHCPEAKRIAGLLDYFGLKTAILQKNFEDLSGGEKQRIVIILAILQDKEIFLLDEITASLDAELKKRTVKYFMKDVPHTVIAISHDKIWNHYKHIRLVHLR